jgi:hypothetical protein
MRQAVYGTARLGLHREFSDMMLAAQGGGSKTLPVWKTVLSSMVSGALASVIGNPFDISMVRMQADSLKPSAGVFLFPTRGPPKNADRRRFGACECGAAAGLQ